MSNPKINPNHRLNPQTETDEIGTWFETNRSFRRNRLLAYLSYKLLFIKKIQQNWLSRLLANFNLTLQYLLFFMTKNVITILFSILTLLCLTGVAAQALAPADLKPTALYERLFKANKQIERDPYTSLKPDKDNFVSKLDQCDLSLKYPKMLSDGSTLGVFREGFGAKEENPLLIQTFVLRSEYLNTTLISNFDFSVSCFKPEYQVPNSQGLAKSITKEMLQQKTGWFITQADIENIKSYPGSSYGSAVGQGEGVEFTFKGKKYLIYSIDKALKASEISAQDLETYYGGELPAGFSSDVSGVFSNQVQVQFDSLIVNQANKDVQSAQNQIKTPTSTTTSNPTITANPEPAPLGLKNQNTITSIPADSKLIRSTFRPNEGCGSEVSESQIKQADEPNYTFSPNENPNFRFMNITNKNYSFNLKDQAALTFLTNFINGANVPISEDGEKDISIVNSTFINSCSGFYNYFVQDLNSVNFGEKNRAVFTLTGQSEFPAPNVFIYAQKGNDLISLSSQVLNEAELNQITKACGFDNLDPKADFSKFDAKCYRDKITSPINIVKANKIAQDLVKTFALK